jgi:predicted Zn-dependent peptidase
VKVGSFNEDDGQTGVAHFLEHMAFKGSSVVGTHNDRVERPIREAQDEVFSEIRTLSAQAEERGLTQGGQAKLAALQDKLAALVEEGALTRC